MNHEVLEGGLSSLLESVNHEVLESMNREVLEGGLSSLLESVNREVLEGGLSSLLESVNREVLEGGLSSLLESIFTSTYCIGLFLHLFWLVPGPSLRPLGSWMSLMRVYKNKMHRINGEINGGSMAPSIQGRK